MHSLEVGLRLACQSEQDEVSEGRSVELNKTKGTHDLDKIKRLSHENLQAHRQLEDVSADELIVIRVD